MGVVFFLFPVFMLDLLFIVMNFINIFKKGSLTPLKLVTPTAIINIFQAMVNMGISVFLMSYPFKAMLFVLGGLITLVFGILMLIQQPIYTDDDTHAKVSSKRVRIYSAVPLVLVALELITIFCY
jgi:hypothetical protein